MHIIFQRVIDNFYDRIKQEFDRLGKIPEFLDGSQAASSTSRNLCQTRAIIFFSLYSKIFSDSQARSYINKIYSSVSADVNFFTKLSSYEIAFLILAQGHAWLNSRDDLKTLYLRDLKESIGAVKVMINTDDCFLSEKESEIYQLNSSMHIFEALGFLKFNGICNVDNELNALSIKISKRFFDEEKYLFAEEISRCSGRYLNYDMGHNFEWISILLEYKLTNILSIDPERLYKTTCTYARPAEDIINPLIGSGMLAYSQDRRIWQSCEYIRASANLGGLDCSYLKNFCRVFFVGNEFREHSSDSNFQIKSTTGYHLIECFKVLPKI